MIEKIVIETIENLLQQEGLSQRQIAKLLGVSRGTVQAVAHGRRVILEKPIRRPFIVPKGPPFRCPHCGGLTQMPCLVCQLSRDVSAMDA